VLPSAGEQTVTPMVLAVQPVAVEPLPTVRVKAFLKTVPVESHACTTTLCVPEETVRLVSRLAA